jgi:hypothetical protein
MALTFILTYAAKTCFWEYYMQKKPIRDKKTRERRKAMKKTKKSDLAKQAEKLFSFHGSDVITHQEYSPSYLAAPVVVQTFTTYSVGEDPIPDLRKQKQA